MNVMHRHKVFTLVVGLCVLLVFLMFVYPSTSSDFRYLFLTDSVPENDLPCSMSCSGILPFSNTRFESVITVDYSQVERNNDMTSILLCLIYALVLIVSGSGCVTSASDKQGRYLVRLLI